MKERKQLTIELVGYATKTYIYFEDDDENLPFSIYIKSDYCYDSDRLYYAIFNKFINNCNGEFGTKGVVNARDLFGFLYNLYGNKNYSMYIEYKNNKKYLLTDDLIMDIYFNLFNKEDLN